MLTFLGMVCIILLIFSVSLYKAYKDSEIKLIDMILERSYLRNEITNLDEDLDKTVENNGRYQQMLEDYINCHLSELLGEQDE